MKKLFPVIFSASLLFFSCGSEENKKNASDSTANAKAETSVRTVTTDSGKLEIKAIAGLKESDAILYSENGKIAQQGKFFDNKPAGAWIKYDQSGNVISAYHYSKGKPSQQLDPQDFNFTTVTKPGFGATFSVPKNWPETPTPDPAHLIVFSKDIKDPSTLSPNFNFRHEKLHPGDSLQSLANMQIQVLHENVNRVDIVSQDLFVVDGCNAIRTYGMFSEESGAVGFLSAIIISGDDVWLLSCEASNNKPEEFLKYQGVFQAILESFKKAK
jgi:hypothetical protein